ncbi:hypothetical protein DUI87_09303 [Hirundo rustica rustica]|uniref:Ig-like domain-containing protein n=1 Tax=Hirundo rustica rustica TaxID=333673 RepID=A0A3M0KLU2_HIRRU|nr:hypothetical protein DUI87_09303 [Hirundo rustica rustica]
MTLWDDHQQSGNTTLRIPKITTSGEGRYTCIVWIKDSFDYGDFELEIINENYTSAGSVIVAPLRTSQDIWLGPPLRISCQYTLKNSCKRGIRISWWKEREMEWDQLKEGSSEWKKESEGVGWYNITSFASTTMAGNYLCIVKCGLDGGFGLREVVARTNPDQGIGATERTIVAVERENIALHCTISQNYTEYGWWHETRIRPGSKYKIMARRKEIALQITNVQKGDDEGEYWCWIARDNWWGHSQVTLRVRDIRVTRQVPERNQTLKIREGQENLIVGLIRDFGRMQNTTSITACLPLPQAAGDPIPWGIIPIREMPSATANVTWNCEIVSKEILDWVEACMLRRKISKQNCQQMPGYYQWIEDPKLNTRILWMDRGSKFKGNCLVIGKVSEPCGKIRVRNKRKKIEEVCQNTTETMTMEEWKTIWGPSLLETYRYLGKVNWCIMWEGKKNQDFGQKSLFKEQYRKKVEMMELWNCTQVLTCDTPPVQIGLEPV